MSSASATVSVWLRCSSERPSDPATIDHSILAHACLLPVLERATARLAQRLGVPAPRLAVDPSEAVNATLALPDGSLLVLSAGLLDRLRLDEIYAVIAHELAHMARKDPGFPAQDQTATLVGRAVAWVRATRWKAMNRHREYRADALAAELVGVDALVRALRKSDRGFSRFGFDTHPRPERRIAKLARKQPSGTWRALRRSPQEESAELPA